jgi:probable FeS assembly SUF system protein SufT
MMREPALVQRDVDATIVPGGQKYTIPKDAAVEIMQALGGSYTVITPNGYMCRIDGKDGDAIGKEVLKGPSEEELKTKSLEELVWDQLKTCYDPEIPVDIANLGLVYRCDVTDHESGEGKNVFIQMTLTAPGCGMGDVLRQDVRSKIEKLPNVKQCIAELVWDPQWNQSMMSDAAKLKLGML